MTAPVITDEAVEVAARAIAIRRAELESPAAIRSASDLELARAALTAAVPLMVGWRPIEGEPDTTKAPWDGKPVDLSDHLERWTNMRWKEGWFRSGDRAISMARHCFTHWSPILPPPPADAQT